MAATIKTRIVNSSRVDSFELEEGNFTFGRVLTQRGYEDGGSFASQLDGGEWLQIDVTADMTLELASTGIKIGHLSEEPQGPLPIADKASGAYVKRIGRVTLLGAIWQVKLASTNAAINAGDYLAIDAGDKTSLDKEEDVASQPTVFVALESAGAASGKGIYAIEIPKTAALEAD